MALGTVTQVDNTVWGNKRIKTYDIQLTTGANYTTGGETLTAATVGLRNVENVLSVGGAKNAAGTLAHGVVYDYVNSKLQAIETGAAVDGPFKEASSNADLSLYTVRITFIGHGL